MRRKLRPFYAFALAGLTGLSGISLAFADVADSARAELFSDYQVRHSPKRITTDRARHRAEHLRSIGLRNARIVRTENQFVQAMRKHREKVRVLALDIAKRFPERFPDVSPAQLDAYIREIHDVGKLEPEMAAKLHRYWGVDIGKLPEAQKEAALQVIRSLNDAEKVAAAEFIGARNIPPEIARQMEAIEKIADGVDRWGAKLSLEEFNRRAMRPTSQFFDDPLLTEIALKYEESDGALYHQLTKGLHYEDALPGHAPNRRPSLAHGLVPIEGCVVRNIAMTMQSMRTPVTIAAERFTGALRGLEPDIQRAARSALREGALERRTVYRVMSGAEFKALRSKELTQKIVWTGAEPKHLYKYGGQSEILVRFEGWTVPYAPGAKEAEHLLLVEGSRVLEATPLKKIPLALDSWH